MIDWLYRHRDPSAVATSALCLGLAWAALHAPRITPAPRPVPDEVVVSLQREPEPEPSTPPKPPEPKPLTPPPPAAPRPPAPQSQPTPSRAPTPQAEAYHPTPAPAQSTAPTAEPAAAPAPVRTAPAPTAAPAPPAPPPEVPRPPAPSPASDDSYKATLRGHLERVKRYPTSREARQLRPAGTVRLALEIGRDGSLLNAQVEASSGSPLLDSEALRTVRNTRFPPFPPDAYSSQNSHRFFVPIEYRLAEE